MHFFANYESIVCVCYAASFYFRDVALAVCGLVEYPRWVCLESMYFFSPASCRYIHKHGGGGEARRERRYVFSAFPLGTLAPRYACIFISRHKRIYWLRFLIRISTLRYTRNKKKSYNSSIIIIYPSYNRKRDISCERNMIRILKQYDKKSLENYESLRNKVSRYQTSIKRRQRSKGKSIVIQIKCLSGIQIKRNSPIFILNHSQF